MSSFDRIGESLELALNCARPIAELSAGLIRNLQEPQDPIRRLRRNLPHLEKQVMAYFPGDERLAADLRHELEGVEEDAFRMADWAASTQDELRVLFESYGTDQDASQRFGLAIDEAFQESERLRQTLFESCSDTHLAAMRVCAATDRTAMIPPLIAAGNPVANSGTPLPDNDQAAIPKRPEVPEEAVSTSRGRDDQIQQLEPAVRRAYRAYEYAEWKAEQRLQDKEAYDQLKANGFLKDSKDWGDLEDYKLPAFGTWAKYLRTARKALGESKYTRRHARTQGKSIVSANQIEPRTDHGK